MKNLIRLSSLLTMVMLLLAGATLTSCSDDDDDKTNGDWPAKFSQKVVFNGTPYDIDEVYGYEVDGEGEEYYVFEFYQDYTMRMGLSIPTKSMNKVLDLTKNQQVGESSVTVVINRTYAFGDEAFSSGSTLIASVSGSTLKIYAKGKALKYNNGIESAKAFEAPKRMKFEPYTFDIQYEGTFKEGGIKIIDDK